MFLYCQNQYNVEPVSKLEVYCKLEGLDSLYIRSIEKKEKSWRKPNKVWRAVERLFRKYMEP